MSTKRMSSRTLRCGVFVAVLAAAQALSVRGSAAPTAPSFAGRWEGAISVPGSELAITVTLTATDGKWSGTIDIPAQGATALPLTEGGSEFRLPRPSFGS